MAEKLSENELGAIAGGTTVTYTYYQPKCADCGWTGELYRTKNEALYEGVYPHLGTHQTCSNTTVETVTRTYNVI